MGAWLLWNEMDAGDLHENFTTPLRMARAPLTNQYPANSTQMAEVM